MKINLASTKLAFVLIAIVVLMLIVSAIVPQREIAEHQVISLEESLGDSYRYIDLLGLDRIYFTPFFFLVLGLLAINLLFGNVRRFRTVYRVERTLLKARHLGSIIFHLALLVVMAGVILNYLYKYSGVLALTEGQMVNDAPTSYHAEFSGPLWPDNYDRFELKVDEISTLSSKAAVPDESARISILNARGDTTVAEIATNRPLAYDGLEIHFGITTGYSPELLLVDSGGQTVVRSFMRVANQQTEGEDIHRDFLILPDNRTRLEVTVWPAEKYGDETFDIAISSHNGPVQSGSLTVGETVDLGSMQFTIPRLRRWCYINIVESPWLNMVFFGFWLGLVGLLTSFLARLKR